jgi:hypothetical protein
MCNDSFQAVVFLYSLITGETSEPRQIASTGRRLPKVALGYRGDEEKLHASQANQHAPGIGASKTCSILPPSPHAVRALMFRCQHCLEPGRAWLFAETQTVYDFLRFSACRCGVINSGTPTMHSHRSVSRAAFYLPTLAPEGAKLAWVIQAGHSAVDRLAA